MVTFEKPAVPTLWLDTSVVIKLAKIEKGEALQRIEVERGKRLQTLVFELVRAGKLLCPESDQEEEYAAERLDDAVHGMFARLSLGISLTHRQGILDQQIFKGMTACAERADTVFLPVRAYFHGDPIRRLNEARRERFIVTVSPWKSPEIVKRRARSKANVWRQWEQLREELRAKGQTYENQLLVEQRGEGFALLENLRRFEADLISGRTDFWNFMAAQGPLTYRHYWEQLGGHPAGWEGVFRFFASPYFSELPQPFVSSRLTAELLTGNESVSSSDPMDIDLLSIALPIAHFVLTDRRMERRIKKLGLDAKYKTAVFSMTSIEGLFAQLETLQAAPAPHTEVLPCA
jgi:hypothetical protein